MATRTRAPNGGKGRPKGARNKVSGLLKDAILQAAVEAGGDDEDGLVAYLTHIAKTQPAAFCGLLGKVLPLTLTGDEGGAPIVTRVVLVAGKAQRDAAVAAALRADG